MKVLQILVLIFGLHTLVVSQTVEKKTTVKGNIFNQAGGIIIDVWVSFKDVK